MSEADASSASRWLRWLLVLVLVFAAGVTAGRAIERMREAAGPPPGRLGADRLPPGLERLGLSDLQRDSVLAILHRARPRTDSIMRGVLPALRAVTDSARAQIETVLTDDQRIQFRRERPRLGR
jgi:hypothetical protein